MAKRKGSVNGFDERDYASGRFKNAANSFLYFRGLSRDVTGLDPHRAMFGSQLANWNYDLVSNKRVDRYIKDFQVREYKAKLRGRNPVRRALYNRSFEGKHEALIRAKGSALGNNPGLKAALGGHQKAFVLGGAATAAVGVGITAYAAGRHQAKKKSIKTQTKQHPGTRKPPQMSTAQRAAASRKRARDSRGRFK